MNVDEIIDLLPHLSDRERSKLQSALFDLQNDVDLRSAIRENLEDIKSGRVSSHEAVMKEIRESL